MSKLRFETTRHHAVEVESDEYGAYELTALEPIRSVTIELSSEETEAQAFAPFADFFSPPVRGSQELDFHLLNARFEAHVVDATTGEGIPGASVRVRNTFRESSEEAEDGEIEKAISQQLAAGAPPAAGRLRGGGGRAGCLAPGARREL